MSYKNNEGYPAPTEGEAIRRASRMPTHVYNDYCLLNNIAGRLGLHGYDQTVSEQFLRVDIG